MLLDKVFPVEAGRPLSLCVGPVAEPFCNPRPLLWAKADPPPLLLKMSPSVRWDIRFLCSLLGLLLLGPVFDLPKLFEFPGVSS